MVARGLKRSSGPRANQKVAGRLHLLRRGVASAAVRRERQLAKAQEIASLGSWQIDFGTGTFFVSDEGRRIFGWREGVCPSVALVLAVTYPDDRPSVEAWLSRPVDGRPRAEECFFRVLREHGKALPLYGCSRVGLSARGEPEILIGTVQDMTRLIGVEREAHRQASFYRGIFENSVWGIFQTTADGQYLAANPALARIYAYDTPVELLSALTNIGGQLYVDFDAVRLLRERDAREGDRFRL